MGRIRHGFCMKSPAPRMVFFPALACNQHCGYCVNHHGDFDGGLPSNLAMKLAPTSSWVDAVSALEDVSEVCWIGGEPGLHPGIAEMIDATPGVARVEIGTNGSKLSVSRMVHARPRANLHFQISYHPTQISAAEFSQNILPLVQQHHGTGVHTPDVLTPSDRDTIFAITGIRVGTMGMITGPGGAIRDHEATSNPQRPRTIECPLEYGLIVAPNGDIYACHALMYSQSQEGILGNLFQGTEHVNDTVTCSQYGRCNPCDLARFTHERTTMRAYRLANGDL